jgi:ubiquinone/menaquinone biosynthesis C-methylase UbiE
MAEQQIRFEDGAGYEQVMGIWSRLAGDVFLDWLAPAAGLRWVDVGCGNGAFTQRIVDRCAPAAVEGFDPSAAQIAYAQARPVGHVAQFRPGDAMAAPYADASFDIAVMALVIFFVPDPAAGVAEMKRIVRPGGCVCSYAWDILGGGFPLAPLGRALRDMGLPPPLPPSVESSRMEALRSLWEAAGLERIATREITVQRRFDSFEALWTTSLLASSIRSRMATMTPSQIAEAKRRMQGNVQQDSDGAITCTARANAIRGFVPA